MREFRRNLLLSQLSLFFGLAIATFINPNVAITNGGVSNFGNHYSTVVFYIAAFSLEIFFIFLASRSVLKLKGELKYISSALLALDILILTVLVSTFPRHFSFTFSYVHDYLGIILFCYQLIFSIWIVSKLTTYLAFGALLVEIVGSVIGLLAILKIAHLLYIGQIVGGIGFSLVLVFCLPELVAKVLYNAKHEKKT